MSNNNSENIESDEGGHPPKSKFRKKRYVYLTVTVLFLLCIFNIFKKDNKKEELVKRIVEAGFTVEYSSTKTGFTWIDNFLTKHFYSKKWSHSYRNVVKIISPTLLHTLFHKSNKSITIHLHELSIFNSLKCLHTHDIHFKELTPLAKLNRLEVLDLGINKITDLEPLSELTNLIDLDLDNNKITDLKPLSKLTNLVILDLRFNKISNLTPLENLINLKKLNLYSNLSLTIKQIDKLQKALPDCKITHNAMK